MENKKVSVIIPSYNHQSFVQDAISSVLNQSYRNFELIVLDDGSKDNSKMILEELAAKFHFKLVLKENEGLCATLNQGLDLSSGEYIVLLASDDTMTPDRIREQVDFMESNPEVDVVAGGMNLMDSKGRIIETKTPKVVGNLNFEGMLRRNLVLAPTAMIRRSVYNNIGKYRADYAFEDYYLWLRLLERKGVIYNTNNIWASYRLDSSSFEKKFVWYFKGYVQVLSDYLPNPTVTWLVNRAQAIFAIKMSLFLGLKAFSKYPSELEGLPCSKMLIVKCLSVTPSKIRKVLLNILLRKF